MHRARAVAFYLHKVEREAYETEKRLGGDKDDKKESLYDKMMRNIK